MKKNLRLGTALMLVVSMFALSACGGKPTTTETPAQAPAEAPAETPKAEEEEAPAPAQEGATLSLNLSSPVGDTHPAIVAFNQFADEVSSGTNGGITVTVYPNGALGDQADGISGLKLGTMDIQHCNSGPAAQVIPELDVFNLPYIFDSVSS